MRTTRSQRTILLAVVFGAAAALGLALGLDRPVSSPGPALDADTGSATTGPDAALAASTVDRLQRFREGSQGRRLRLTAEEVTAVLRHAAPGMLPAGVSDPVVRVEGGAVRVEARLASEVFAGSAPLASVLGALPDTVDVDLIGRLEADGDRLVFTVERARASRVPLPAAVVSAVARALAERAGERIGHPTGNATLSIRWPEDVALVAIVDDRFVLGRGERIVDRAVDGIDDS